MIWNNFPAPAIIFQAVYNHSEITTQTLYLRKRPKHLLGRYFTIWGIKSWCSYTSFSFFVAHNLDVIKNEKNVVKFLVTVVNQLFQKFDNNYCTIFT